MSDYSRDVFNAIADPTRRRILRLLIVRALTINALSDNFDSSRQAVTKHLKILEQAGLVEIHSSGRERVCSAKPAKLREVHEWTAYFERFWTQKLGDLETYLDEKD